MDVGSVGFVSKFRDVAKLARAVMTYTSHTLLVGEGADEFGTMIGFTPYNPTTNTSTAIYEDWQANNCQPNFYQNLQGCDTSCGPYPSPLPHQYSSSSASSSSLSTSNPRKHQAWASKDQHDTIGTVAIDQDGNMACGTSTNGASHKVGGHGWVDVRLSYSYKYIDTTCG